MKTRKVGIIGLWHVGAHVAYSLALQGIADELVLVDCNEKKVQSECQDLRYSVAYLPHRVTVNIGTYEDLGDCDVIKMDSVPSEEQIFRMGIALSRMLQGCALNEIDGKVVSRMQADLQEYQELLQPILNAITVTMRAAEKVQVHMSGAKNMLAFPEFADVQKAKSLFQTLEEKEQLVTMLKENADNDIHIMIGSENSVQGM